MPHSCPTRRSDDLQGPLYYVARVQGVSHSHGYLLKPVYASDATKLDWENIDAWGNVTDVIAVNTAVESCSSSADTCTLTGNWPKRSTSTPPPFRTTWTYDANGRVATATNHGVQIGRASCRAQVCKYV